MIKQPETLNEVIARMREDFTHFVVSASYPPTRVKSIVHGFRNEVDANKYCTMMDGGVVYTRSHIKRMGL